MSESAVIELGYSDLLIKLGASSECPVTDLGDKSLAGMLVPGSVVSLKDLLVETEHAIVEEDPEEYDLGKFSCSCSNGELHTIVV